MRHQALFIGNRIHQIVIGFDGIDGGKTQAPQIRHLVENSLHQLAETQASRKIGTVGGHVHAGQHHFGITVADKALDLIHHRAHRNGAGITTTIGNNAEGAAMIAAILHLHESARATFDGIDHMACGFAHFHNVVDTHFLELVDAEIRQHPVGIGFQFFLIAKNEVDFVHGGKIVRFGLCCASGDDDAGFRVFTAGLADRLTRLSPGFCRHGAGVEDDRAILQFAKSGGIGFAFHHL